MGRTCHLGCENPRRPFFQFPSVNKDPQRRSYWMQFFGLEDSNAKSIYACARHFSSKQDECGIRNNVRVPDISLNDLETSNLNISDSLQMEETFNNQDTEIKPLLKSCSSYSQTNTRICGSVEISETLAEYQLNCFYCSDVFPIVNWSEFVDHLTQKHYESEKAFQIENCETSDHDYIIKEDLQSPLLENEKLNSVKAEPLESNESPLDVELAETVIKVLDETLFNANFKPTETKFKINSTESSCSKRVLKKILPTKRSGSKKALRNKPNINSTTEPSTSGSKKVIENKSTIKEITKTEIRRKRTIASKLKTNIARFKKTLKKNRNLKPPLKPRPRKIMSSGIFYIKYIVTNKEEEKQNSKQAVPNRCLESSFVGTPASFLGNSEVKPTEIVFEFTPRGIIMDLLENIKNYPILWEFHKEPNNEDYDKTIDELCWKMNNKWSLNISTLQMRRSINRIFAYYCSMLYCDKVEIFQEYFVKLSEFLPSSKDGIPQKRCVYCDVCYRKDYELKKHLVDGHVYLKWAYECDFCFERFMEKEEYELHNHLPHLKEIFKCQECKKAFQRIDIFNRHMREHEKQTLKSHRCNLCGKGFYTSSELSSHKNYLCEKNFKCHLCEKAYYRQFCLNEHLKRHRNERNFVCEICGKAFLTPTSLQNHKAKHTGEKITCNICNTKLSKSSLSRHLRLVHVAYEGTIESTFRSKAYNYKRYINTNKPRGADKVDRKYICKHCHINFVRLKLLKDHNKEYHPDVQKLPCKICDSQLINTTGLRRHYKEKHKLHLVQICKLVDGNDDVDEVLNIKPEDITQFDEVDRYTHFKEKHSSMDHQNKDASNPNDEMQYELMQAVEHIENHEGDDDYEIKEFFVEQL